MPITAAISSTSTESRLFKSRSFNATLGGVGKSSADRIISITLIIVASVFARTDTVYSVLKDSIGEAFPTVIGQSLNGLLTLPAFFAATRNAGQTTPTTAHTGIQTAFESMISL
jgi:hypothetical protein